MADGCYIEFKHMQFIVYATLRQIRKTTVDLKLLAIKKCKMAAGCHIAFRHLLLIALAALHQILKTLKKQ